ncbi:MAG: riboflavin synthase [Acidobacteria bacterium]|nr:MAG: riboflavin synthase [Acidobacteriota bacterium]
MFTGIVKAIGKVEKLARKGAGARMEIGAPTAMLKRMRRGDSIAVNGCCLTMVAQHAGRFTADLSEETLAKTALGGYSSGTRVNLELPLRMGDPLGGHMMQGHVEGTGKLLGIKKLAGDGGWWMRVGIPAELRPLLVPKGSIAVDGISLTVAALTGNEAGFAIIPHTWQHTNLRWLKAGATMNLETDPIARHVEQLLAARAARSGLSERALRAQGF